MESPSLYIDHPILLFPFLNTFPLLSYLAAFFTVQHATQSKHIAMQKDDSMRSSDFLNVSEPSSEIDCRFYYELTEASVVGYVLEAAREEKDSGGEEGKEGWWTVEGN